MAIPARCAAMIDATPAFIRDAGVRASVFGIPVVGVVAAVAVIPEHAAMENRVAVTTRTEIGSPGKDFGMARLARQPGMPPG